MKNLFLFFTACLLFLSAEARVNSDPKDVEIRIKDERSFTADPLKYVRENFQLSDYVDQEEAPEEAMFQAKFVSNKGYLKALFDLQSNLQESYVHFEDIMMPFHVRNIVYKAYKGFTVTNVDYRGYGKKGGIEREIYKITLEKEGKVRQMKVRRRV